MDPVPYDPSKCDHDCPLCDRKFAKGDTRKALAKHVKEHHQPDPGDLRFKVWMEASGRFWCAPCGSSFSCRLPHGCTESSTSRPARNLPSTASLPRLGAPAIGADEVKTSSAEAKVVTPTCVLPALMDIFATSIPSVKRIPQQCRVAVAKAFTTIMRNCSVEGTQDQQMRAWKLQFMFPKCVLRLQPDIRGGKKKKLRRNESLRAGLLERLKRWNDGEVDVLWAEAGKLYSSGSRQVATSSLASNIRRATECAQDARYGKAVSSLLSLGTCPVTEETLKEMKSKHPGAMLPTLPSGPVPDAVRFDADLVRKKIDGFPAAVLEGHLGMPQQSSWC